jgi:hypothetical protein
MRAMAALSRLRDQGVHFCRASMSCSSMHSASVKSVLAFLGVRETASEVAPSASRGNCNGSMTSLTFSPTVLRTALLLEMLADEEGRRCQTAARAQQACKGRRTVSYTQQTYSLSVLATRQTRDERQSARAC